MKLDKSKSKSEVACFLFSCTLLAQQEQEALQAFKFKRPLLQLKTHIVHKSQVRLGNLKPSFMGLSKQVAHVNEVRVRENADIRKSVRG